MEPVECAPGEVCTPYLFSDVSVCGEACDPLAEGCPGGQLCLPQGDGWLCVDDASGDGGAPGDPCEFKNSCDSGLVCLSYVYFEGCDGEACCSP
ncbi:MAG: hypothetical protein KDA28_14695, partial [Phycisphaerales bacterium]|nr:hypothetical protein [Phycisphaerales bacterium]